MDAIDLTGSGSDEDDPKRRLDGFGAYAAPTGSSVFATSSSGAAGTATGATANPSSSSSPTHRPLGQQPLASSSSHNNVANDASSSSSHSHLPHPSTSSHFSPTTNNTIHRPHSSASGAGTAGSSGFPPNVSVAKSQSQAAAAADDDVMVTGQSGPSFGAMLGAASAAAHYQPPPRYPSGSYANGAGPGPSTAAGSSSASAEPSGPSRSNDGASAAAAIDVDSLPPAPVSRRPNPKKPVCIGAFMSRAIMLYPQSCAMAGCGPPQGSKWDLVNFRGVEMIRVKLKVSTCHRYLHRTSNAWSWPGGFELSDSVDSDPVDSEGRWRKVVAPKGGKGRTTDRRQDCIPQIRTHPTHLLSHADDNSCAGLEHRDDLTSRGRL